MVFMIVNTETHHALSQTIGSSVCLFVCLFYLIKLVCLILGVAILKEVSKCFPRLWATLYEL